VFVVAFSGDEGFSAEAPDARHSSASTGKIFFTKSPYGLSGS
jgi:hypothetical protein